MAEGGEDLNVISHLLEKKQNDLELAAEIGQHLLAEKSELEKRLREAEEKLRAAEDLIDQLKYAATFKDNLLSSYARDLYAEDDDRTSISSGLLSPGLGNTSDSGAVLTLSANVGHLNRRLRELEEENTILRQEHQRLSSNNCTPDGNLVRDCIQQLAAANVHIRTLSDEMSKRSDCYVAQQKEITSLSTRSVDLENRVQQLLSDNESLTNQLEQAQNAQQLLTLELGGLRDKYDECLALLNEAKTELRRLRKRCRQAVPPMLTQASIAHPGSPAVAADSSDSEESGLHSTNNQPASWSLEPNSCAPIPCFRSPNSHTLAAELGVTVRKERRKQLQSVGPPSGLFTQAFADADESIKGLSDDSVDKPDVTTYHSRRSSVPASGRNHTASTVYRSNSLPHDESLEPLSVDSATPANPCSVIPETDKYAVSNERSMEADRSDTDIDHKFLVNVSAVGSSDASFIPSHPRLPQRLKLVKTLDGSEVLQQWQKLATPSFTQALFDDPPPGVQSRAGAGLVHAGSAKEIPKLGKPLVISVPTKLINTSTPVPGSSRRSVSALRSTKVSSQSNHRLSDPMSEVTCIDRFGSRLDYNLLENCVRHSLSGPSTNSLHKSSVYSPVDDSPKAHRVGPNELSTALPTQNIPSGFSLSALVSALLPFPIPSASPTLASRRMETVQPKLAKTSRLNPSGPSRGLLEVSNLVPPSGSTSGVKLPSPISPSTSVLTDGNPTRRIYNRAPKSHSLKEIEEENGSPVGSKSHCVDSTTDNPNSST